MNITPANVAVSLVFVFIILCATSMAIPPEPPLGYRWVLQDAFSDEFNGSELDQDKWYNYYPGWAGRAPARFEPKALSVKNGKLEIQNGVLDQPKGRYTMYGGAIVSKSTEAHYGYYECCFKASKIAMSTTFWLSNGKEPFTEKWDREDDSYSQELDIQEAVGGGTVHQKFRDSMNCNTHYRYKINARTREKFYSKGAGTKLHSEVSDDYHIYGAWWKNAWEVEFYANNKFFEMVKFTKEISEKPFARPMHVNMVTETYDWQPAPSFEDLRNDEINTSYYDWVRAYKLVKVHENYDHPITEVDIYDAFITIDNVSENIVDTNTLIFVYTYATNNNATLAVKIIEGNKKQTTLQENQFKAFEGYGQGTLSIPLTFKPEAAKHYRIQVELLDTKNKSIDAVRYDVSK